MLVTAKYSASTLTYKVYDGSAWGDDTNFGSKTASASLFSITMATMSGQVHLAVIPAEGGGALSYYYYTTSWSSATTVDSSTCLSPCLSATTSNLYVFYAVSTNILYRTMDYSTHTWSSATTLASSQTSPNMINTERYPSGEIGVLWRQGSASPYSIMFAYLSLAPPKAWNDVETWFISLLTMKWNDVENWFVKLWTMAWRNVEEWSFQFIVLVCHTIEEWFVNFWTLEAIYITTSTIKWGMVFTLAIVFGIVFALIFEEGKKK
jgi:hypothetical protein